MRRSHFASIVAVILSVFLTVLAGGPAEATRAGRTAAATTPPAPASMSALGDSITRGYNAGGWFADWPARSWSTGSYSTVNSHYLRLKAVNSQLVAYNDARSGAKIRDLAGQASTSVLQQAQYVTILMGANDACTSTEAGMTSVDTFETQMRTAMNKLAAQNPRPKVFVASIPDIHQLWFVGKDKSSARNAWAAYGICQSMLANPLSTASADVSRRAGVQQRVRDFNDKLRQVCAVEYADMCKYDDGAVFAYPFTLSQLSTWDYFHPNTTGQKVIADVTYKKSYWATP